MKNRDRSTECPACICAELDMAAYSAGVLGKTETQRLFEHLLSCPGCLEVAAECIDLEEIQRFRRRLGTEPPDRRNSFVSNGPQVTKPERLH